MDPVYAPWIALGCALVGMLIGYFMGYRTGKIAGELAALKSTRSRRERSLGGSRQISGEGRNQSVEENDDLEYASRTSDS